MHISLAIQTGEKQRLHYKGKYLLIFRDIKGKTYKYLETDPNGREVKVANIKH